VRHNAVFALLAVALTLAACNKPDLPPPAATVRPVLVQALQAASTTPILYSGEVRARHESDLAFRVPGKIVARLVDVGARVERGKALARLDPADLQLNAQAAKAQLAAAESDLSLAEGEQVRYAALLERKLISQSVYDAKATVYKAARARRDQAKAQLAVIDNQAEYSTLTADHTGVVTAVLAEVGQVVAAGQPVLKLARPDEQEIVINIPEGSGGRTPADKGDDGDAVGETGTASARRVAGTGPGADAATRTYAARIRLLAADPAVRLGMTAQVMVQPAASDGQLLVPLTAVVEHGAGPAVWVVADGKAQRRPVTIGQYREEGAVLASGVQAGELVVTVGAHKLVAGQAVRPVMQDAVSAGTRP
jgi:multidrug efflux system membrane fusion protein